MENHVKVITIVDDHLHVLEQNHQHLEHVDVLYDMILSTISVVRE